MTEGSNFEIFLFIFFGGGGEEFEGKFVTLWFYL